MTLFGIGAAIAFAAIGSSLGMGTAGMSAIGAWKKCYAQGKSAPFLLVALVGAPLTQTIYGLLLMQTLQKIDPTGVAGGFIMGAGVVGGLALGFSAWYQGKAAAVGCDALAETGKGFANYLTVLGLVETTALFTMVFLMMASGSYPQLG